MKIIPFLILLIVTVTGCNGSTANVQISDEHKIIYKVHKKNSLQDIDTIWVSQNDTTVFLSEEVLQRRMHQSPQFVTQYKLRKPLDGTYYFIHNPQGQLILEGVYSARYIYEGKTLEEGNFYNSKTYYYKKNGNLNTIHYQADGRTTKIEHFDQNRQLTWITFFKKNSGDKEKVEVYKNGKLKETRIYTAFDVYHTIEVD